MGSLRRLAAGAALGLAFTGAWLGPAYADSATGEAHFSIGPGGMSEAGELGTLLFPVYETKLSDQVRAGEPDFFAYCIERNVKGRYSADVVPGPWSEFPGDNNFKDDPEVQRRVGWIVNHSYPTVSLENLRQITGISGLTGPEAISGTQHAIWYLTDDYTRGLSANAEALRSYLTGEANVGLPEGKVRPDVRLNLGESANTHVGAPIGPITAEANTPTIAITTDPTHRLVDGTGESINTAALPSGQEFYLDIPHDADSGSTRVTAMVNAATLNGSILKVPPAVSTQTHAQTLILVTSATARSQDVLEVAWTPKPLIPVAPGMPEVQVETCEAPGDSLKAHVDFAPTDGLTYSFDPREARPGAILHVRAIPEEGYEVMAAEGWSLIEDGSAVMEIEIPEAACPPEREAPPTPQAPVDVPDPAQTPEQTPDPSTPVTSVPPVVEVSSPAVEEVPTGPVLAETGLRSPGLIALAGALVAGGIAATVGIRQRKLRWIAEGESH